MIIEIQNISLSLKEREGLAGPCRAEVQCEYRHQWWQKLVSAPPDTMLLNTFLLRLLCQNI